jgi:hypothetical protein
MLRQLNRCFEFFSARFTAPIMEVINMAKKNANAIAKTFELVISILTISVALVKAFGELIDYLQNDEE